MLLNTHQLVSLSVMGEIAHPTVKQAYRVAPIEGQPVILPSVGGISYNIGVGSPCMGLMADHIEPGISIRNPHDASNRALNTYACVGNIAKVVSGEAKGALGWVIGKHGGVEHVMIQLQNPQVQDQLLIGDRFLIRSFGLGLALTLYPDITVLNCDPKLLPLIAQATADQLNVGVTHHIPAHLLGAGLGEETCYSGDVDIQMFDQEAIQAAALDSLRFGDVVAMMDCDHRYGRIYRKNWVSIGVVVHSCSVQAGHGPGITTLLSGPCTNLNTTHDPSANLSRVLPLLDRQ